jgi:hypothetical protein
MGCGGSSDPSSYARQQQQQQEKWTNQAVAGIDKSFSGFNPAFYSGIGQAYQNYALPQVQQQYQQNANQLGYKLAGQGLQNSSVAQTAGNALQGAMSQAQQQVGNEAVSQQNAMKKSIADEQAQLYSQAQSTTNPTALIQQSLNQASATAAPSTFAPIGNMFNQFGQLYLAGQNANMYNTLAQNYLNQTNNPGLYNALGTGYAGAMPQTASYR